MEVKRYKPEATVLFFTESGNLILTASETDDFNNKAGDLINKDMVSVSTNRDLGADAPTFSVVLTRRRSWHKYIAPNDRIVISMVRPPEAVRTVMVGLADDIRKTVTFDENGGSQRTITVTGRGVVKALIQFDIGQVPESTLVDPQIGWLAHQGIVFAGSNADIIIWTVWTTLAKKFVNYKFADGKTLFDIAKTKLSARPNARMKDDLGLLNWQGSLWAFIKEIADEPFNEIFWETDGKDPILTVRPTPFNKPEWDKLPVYTITDEEVVLEDIGRSDVETYTLFSVGMKSYFSSEDSFKTTGILPLWYKPYQDRYGIRRLHMETMYSAWAGGSYEEASITGQELTKYQQDLFNWNIKNNAFYNGTFAVRGSNRFKVGTRLSYTSADENGETLEFYIRSVTHTFTNFGSWVTVLRVIRGCKPTDRFSAPVGSFTDYAGVGWDFYNPSAGGEKVTYLNSYTESTEYKDVADKVIAGAIALMNTDTVRYTFGGPGIEKGRADCSQFTQYIFKKYAGLTLGRSTNEQIQQGITVASKNALIKGDLVLFTGTYQNNHLLGVSHVGIYIGGADQSFIQLSGGEGVGKINISTLNNSYWKAHFLRGQRVIPGVAVKVVGKSMIDVVATAYGGATLNGGAGTWQTSTGVRPVEGRTIAVDPKVIPIGSKVTIECPDYPWIHNHTFTAEDIGSAIKGNRIDIYFEDKANPAEARRKMMTFGKRTLKITVQPPN